MIEAPDFLEAVALVDSYIAQDGSMFETTWGVSEAWKTAWVRGFVVVIRKGLGDIPQIEP